MRQFWWGVAVLSLLCSTASAQWLTQTRGGEFDDAPTILTATMSGGAAFGFRCRGNELKAIFITPEKFDDDSLLADMNAESPKLRIRIDNGPVMSFDADLDNPDGKLGVLADVDVALVKAVSTAKSKVSTVLTVIGKNFHETTFTARGSTAEINKLLAKCPASGSN